MLRFLVFSVFLSSAWRISAAVSPLQASLTRLRRAAGIGGDDPFAQLPAADYEFVPNLGYYKFHDYATSWCIANQICSEEGAHLLVVNSEREAELVNTLFERFPAIRGDPPSPNWAWLGLHEKGINGRFFSVLGESVESTGFNRWSEGYPQRPGANDCALIARGSANMADDPCSYSYAFICEHFANSATDAALSIDKRIKAGS